MNWLETSICTTSEGIDIVTALVLGQGVGGVEILDDEEMKNFLKANINKKNYADYIEEELLNKETGEVKVRFYLSDDENGKLQLNNIEQSLKKLSGLGRLAIEINKVNDEDWENNWKKHYKPFEIGRNIVLKPQWEKYENTGNKLIFNINPGHLFGTGLHETTKLCIEELENHITDKSVVLDLGCGTGILSIISRMLGAKHAVAVDIEPDAPKIAGENAELNNVLDNYDVYVGNVLEDEVLRQKLKKYNVIIANIVADVIIAMLSFMEESLDDDGILILSGIIKERKDDVVEALDKKSFAVKELKEMGSWVSIVARRNK